MATPNLTFNNGHVMPLFGLGTWLSNPGEVSAAVKIALESGYYHIDCAHCYGNEQEVGEAFTSVFSSGTVKREDVFVTSKLWVKDFGHVKEACKITLKNLCLDYLDLYLIHLPFEVEHDYAYGVPMKTGEGLIGYTPDRIQSVWKAMEELVKEGLVRSIGISNFTIKKTKELLSSSPKVVPACNQVEMHPYLQQNKLADYSKEKGIALVAYSPLANPGRPASFKADDEKPLIEDVVVSEIAKKHKCTNAQVLLAWGIARGTGVLAKSVKEHRIKENLAALQVKLDEDAIKLLNGIEYRYRYCKQEWALKVGEKTENLWDGEMLG